MCIAPVRSAMDSMAEKKMSGSAPFFNTRHDQRLKPSLQAAVGAGVFVNGNLQPSLGAYAAGAALAYAGRGVKAAPAQQTPPNVGVLYAGYGPGIFIANAGSAKQLGGPFWTGTVYSNGVWIF